MNSGDIDAVIVHIFAVSCKLPRHENGKFKCTVYVRLDMKGYFDLYDITAIVETLESVFGQKQSGMKLAIGLCLGGNDFLPRFQRIPHQQVIALLFSNNRFLTELFNLTDVHARGLKQHNLPGIGWTFWGQFHKIILTNTFLMK